MRSAILVSALVLAVAPLGICVAPTQAQPVVVEEPAPPYVEEGATLNGVVVTVPPDADDFVFINGGWFFYHPLLRTWVHVHRDRDWLPPRERHVYHRWSEHPRYHERDHEHEHDRH